MQRLKATLTVLCIIILITVTAVWKLDLHRVVAGVQSQSPKNTKVKKTEDSLEISTVTKILVLTYMRSGSSFVGELMKFGGDVFLSFEPFWGVFKTGYRTKNEICYRNNTCQHPKKNLQKVKDVSNILRMIFDCRISQLPIQVLHSFIKFPLSSGYSQRCKTIFTKTYSSKQKLRQKIHKSFENRTHWCMKRWEKACHKSKARVVKSIRISTVLINDIISAIPGLKVVHLIRHPAGILNSRIDIGILNSKEISESARQLCKSMEKDAVAVKDFSKKGLDITPLSFECLVKKPFIVVRKLFDHLSLNFTDKTSDWIYSHMQGNEHKYEKQNKTKAYSSREYQPAEGYRIHKANSKHIVMAWKEKLPKNVLQRLDAICETLYKTIELPKSTPSENNHPKYGGSFC